MEELREKYPEEVSCYLDGYKKIIGDQELEWQKRLLNPLNFIPRKGENESSVLAPYYRIRVGAKDADTSLTVNHAFGSSAYRDKQNSGGLRNRMG